LPDREGLARRDRWAAGVIVDRMGSGRDARMICLMGELHLASKHLPRQIAIVSKAHLGVKLTTTVVHQNRDEIFWKLARKGRAHDSSVVRVGKNYCVISSTPWAKLQSLVNWIEGQADLEVD